MKTKIYISVILSALALYGCSDADKSIKFETDRQAFELGAAGGKEFLHVASDNNWIATTDEPWITISPANGSGSTDCQLLIDSALTASPRRGVVRIQNQSTWENKEITIEQQGYDYAIKVDDKEVAIENFAAYGKRYFDVKISTNVDFDIQVPTSAESWLKFEKPVVEFDRGIRPREVTVRFNWGINSRPDQRIAEVVFAPKESVELAQQDGLKVTQQAAEPIKENTREGDSVSLLAIARTLNTYGGWDSSDRMDNWDGVTLWEEGMEGYTPAKEGRVKYAQFFMSASKEELPFEVQYLTAADELSFFSNENKHMLSLGTGEYITKLTQLRRLSIVAYGLTELHKDFGNLKNLESLDLGSNNFLKIPAQITQANFPKLRSLVLNANVRKTVYDLSNNVDKEIGGFIEENENLTDEGCPKRLIELFKWDLDTLVLSVNYLQGQLPSCKDWETYTEQDIIEADTLPRALIGIPKVMPHTKQLNLNLNRFYGTLPDWLLYHPALNWWDPYTLIFNQEGKTSTGKLAAFNNEPVNMNYYYEFYKGFKNPNFSDDEEEETGVTTK